MCTIIRASQEYKDPAWVAYDIAYRQQAAATHHKDWSKINPSPFPLCFSSSAKKASHCSHCNALGHMDVLCPLRGKEEPDITQRVHAVEPAVLVFSNAGRGKFSSNSHGWGKGVCHEFNAGNCTHHPCKFHHVCSSVVVTIQKWNVLLRKLPHIPDTHSKNR